MRWLIVAGGTGGHIFPGLALAQSLLERGREVYFISGTRKIERLILKNKPFPVLELEVEGFLGRALKDKIKASYKMIKAFLKACKFIKTIEPQIIFATGGYISFPVVLAGKLKGKRTSLHEQNLEPGLANKVLSKLVDKVFISIPGSEKFFPSKKVVFSGNPVRGEIKKRREKEHSGKGLLILGGSLGARFINQLALKVVPQLLAEFENLLVIHQTGLEDLDWVREEYLKILSQEQLERIKVFSFIEDMAWAYAQADLILGRAGATTLAELFALGKPALFIPFPYATKNHQERNAEIVAKKGGAFYLRQEVATPDRVYSLLKELFQDEKKLKNMAKAMEDFYVENSEEIIIKEMEALVENA
ncbi:MAG: undecaprenyldiphospho-muramoylpentapeptide beta-N-acetylglucosaminyltransferase [Thermodesulfobacteriaceae bacterium]|nr:undecaprenyldiphospho-muramoylpentapeptide beta-N-acetylglucosaminyltransferase [Thermodesulfobacteriaceae bacterium]MCX8041617.1 undecaprenyldiphospho-muramoylpentapeptide beta-N-acetylglucosaminyltransferase [Thermodesulfobacteriaceae bacterium]MDW8135342.1 undecaprenyldiphospho-muramoylpentapeptide beta-N-acetylglucosaminyltransferase [Thermodesulfobacterium sp.]